MTLPIDLTGQRSGRLVAIRDVGSTGRQRVWLVRCDCGKERFLIAGKFRAHLSCGCLHRDRAAARARDMAKLYTVGSETFTLVEWAKRLGTTSSTLRVRLHRGWPVDRALTNPTQVKRGGSSRTPTG